MLTVEIRLKAVLAERDITQKDLAKMTGIRPNAISMMARGYVERLNLDHIARIADALNITDIRELVTLIHE